MNASMVIPNINPKSTIISGLTGIGVINELNPKINKMLNMLDPTIFPITIWFSFLLSAVRDVTSSGSEVPIATMVNPTRFHSFPLP